MQAEKTFHILDERYHVDFDYTGNVQKFEAPYDGIYQIELWGASGGVPDDISYGQGAYTKGSIHLKKGDTFYVYVGEKGKNNRTVSFNGGGYGGYGKEIGWSGGGATDIRLMNGNWNNLEGLKSRVMVAGGGGGVASVEYNTAGGSTQSGGTGQGGGGGSSFISGHTGCNAVSKEGIPTGQANHYSGYIFKNTSLLGGRDKMPNPRSQGDMTGNDNNGYVRIKYISF